MGAYQQKEHTRHNCQLIRLPLWVGAGLGTFGHSGDVQIPLGACFGLRECSGSLFRPPTWPFTVRTAQ